VLRPKRDVVRTTAAPAQGHVISGRPRHQPRPIVVARLEDDEPDIVIVHPIDVMQTVWLKGVKTPDGTSWEFRKQR
jgi:hypothetical protein